MYWQGNVYYLNAEGEPRVACEFQGIRSRTKSEALGQVIAPVDERLRSFGVATRVKISPSSEPAERLLRVISHCVDCGSDFLIGGRCMQCASFHVIEGE